MFLIVEKGIRSGICHAIHRCAKANNKYMKIMIKTSHHHTSSPQTICTIEECLKNCL